jgi:class 3 adenylate cyclase
MNPDAEKLYQIVILVQEFFGAVILGMFYLWLSRRQVKDPSLKWLCVSLLSWSIAAFAGLLMWNNASIKPIIPFMFSPISSILLTMTAFRFSRVQEAIHRHKLQRGQRLSIWIVSIASCVAAGLVIFGGGVKKDVPANVFTSVGMNLDAVVSCCAIVALGIGLSYSFYKYKNYLLIALTILDLLYITWRQFNLVYLTINGAGPSNNSVLAALNIASYTTLTMIFISLAVAWSLSDASRLKRVGISPCVEIITLIFDLRGSTAWSRRIEREHHDHVGTFMDELLELGSKTMSVLPFGRPNLVKYLGDGYMLVWELPDDSVGCDRMNAVVGAACNLYDTYPVWAKDASRRWAEAPRSIGIGVDRGCAKRHTFENGSVDYQGSPVNNAAKMQDLARPDGGVVIRRDYWENLSAELSDKFPEEGRMLIGQELISVRATKGVTLPNADYQITSASKPEQSNGDFSKGEAISVSPV